MPLSDWRVTSWSGGLECLDPSFGRFETQTEKGLVIYLRAAPEYMREDEFTHRWRTVYEMRAVAPNHSEVCVREFVYQGDRGGSQLEDLYDRLYAHFLPAERRRRRQQAEDLRKQQREKEDDILEHL
jgi:hypothetical protein